MIDSVAWIAVDDSTNGDAGPRMLERLVDQNSSDRSPFRARWEGNATASYLRGVADPLWQGHRGGTRQAVAASDLQRARAVR